MRKISIILSLTILFFSGIFWFRSTNRRTPEQLLQAEFEVKRNKKLSGESKFNGPDQFIKLHQQLRTPYGEKASKYPTNYQFIEFNKAQQQRKFRRESGPNSLQFVERGPANVPGRTRGILVDGQDTSGNTWLVASVGGGIWKTTNAGQAWQCKTDELPNLAITCIASSLSNQAVMYAGSGEGFGNVDAIAGNGIFKSTDRGETWVQLSSTSNDINFKYVNRLVVNPQNANYVVAATNAGIFISSNAGNTWQKTFEGPAQDLRATAGNFQILFAGINRIGVAKSTDAGLSWSVVNNGLKGGGRFEIAISPVKTDRIFASAQGNGSSDLYISDNGGENWNVLNEQNGGANENFHGAQGWYNNTLEAHPFNKDIVYVGGIDQWKVTVKGDEVEGNPTVTGLDVSSVQSFITFVNFSASLFGGILEVGGLSAAEFRSLEIRFGNGAKQKAHRFSIPTNSGTNGDGGAGVPANEYIYEDYVEVPFEVWDVENNVQLMASFRDQENNGIFDLEPANASDETRAREYLYVNAVTYNANAPSSLISKNGGHEERKMYFMWPRLVQGNTWDSSNIPESKIKITYGIPIYRNREMEVVTDAYIQRGGKNNEVHVDQHNIVPFVINTSNKTFKLIIANDGGVWATEPDTDPGFANNTWSFTGKGYNTTQFYGADKRPGSLEFFAGAQDNGTWKSEGEATDKSAIYGQMFGGDGFEALWNNYDPDLMIGSAQFNTFYRTDNGGDTWEVAREGITDSDANSPFISRLANAKSNPDFIFAIASSGVWRSENFGGSWEKSALPASSFSLSYSSNVKVSLAKSKVVWAFDAMTEKESVHVSVDGGKTFAPVNNYAESTMGNLSGFGTHPNEWATAYALFSFAQNPKILKTNDLGQTWTDISGFGSGTASTNGFPDVAVYSLLVMPHNPNWIWVGTEIGLVESTDGGETWALADYNLPAAAIWDMKWMDDQIILATHGRGLWTVEIPELPDLAFDPILTRVHQIEGLVSPTILLVANFRSVYDSTLVLVNGELAVKLLDNEIGPINLSVNTQQPEGSQVIIKSYKEGREYESYQQAIGGILSSTKPLQNIGLLKVYPNPTSGKISIVLDSQYPQALTVSVYTYLGKLVKKMILPILAQNNKLELDLEDLNNGLYIIEAEGEFIKGQSRIVIER